MELSTTILFGVLPVLFLGASVGLAVAYNRLHGMHGQVERERESYLEVLEGSYDALFVINFVNGRILQANARAGHLLGYDRAALEGLTIFQLHPQEFLHQSAMRIADAWEQKGSVYQDIPLLTAQGERIQVECSTKVTSYAGKPAVILFARDIRERLALEQRVALQQAELQQTNADLVAGIRYAQRIQRAVLPEPERLQEIIPDSFILFRPRDIVSGDLYWFAEREGHLVVAAADCTGHGVPGALLSVVAASLFEEQVVAKGMLGAADILEAAREGMIAALNRNDESTESRDGMNVGLAVIGPKRDSLRYAGAYGPLYLVRSGELIEYKGDRMPIGAHHGEVVPFREELIELQAGDRIFLFSDGMVDQFGGPQGKKLRSAGLKQWLLETSTLPMDDQYQAISDRFRMWKGKEEQVDDVLLIGIAV